MDYTPFDDILKHIYELEGLVMVARRDNAERNLIIQSMQEKIGVINSLLDNECQHAAQADCHAQPMNETPYSIEDSSDEQVVSDSIDETPDTQDFTKGAETISTEIDYKPGDSTPIGLMAAVSDDDEEDAAQAEEDENHHALPECDDDGKSCHDSTEEPAKEMTFDYTEPKKIEQEEPETDDDRYMQPSDDDDDTQSPLTIDTMLQRNMSRDLKHAFTVNDRYRFCRELFGNSTVEMNDALNLVETMQSYAEAEEYFYGAPLSWDKESPEVIDFMAILRNHFYAK